MFNFSFFDLTHLFKRFIFKYTDLDMSLLMIERILTDILSANRIRSILFDLFKQCEISFIYNISIEVVPKLKLFKTIFYKLTPII